MASGDDGEAKSSWWGWDKIIKTAKEKTLSTLEIVKHDFTEFKTVMTEDTANLINQATAQFVESTNTASYLLDTFDNKIKLETNNRHLATSTVQERYENELKAIQLSEATYLFDSENNDAEEYATWKKNFDCDANKAVISDLLIENSSMRLIYSKLVPAQVSNETFWCRYFYRTSLFEEEQKKRIKLLERVKEATTTVKEEEGAEWDDDEDEKTIEEGVEQKKEQLPAPVEEGVEEEISKEITDLVIKEETESLLNEMTTAAASGVESMVTSIKTEDSDDWDKMSDTSDCEKKKQVLSLGKSEPAGGQRRQSNGETKSDEWDDWGE